MEPSMEIISSDGRRVGHVGLARARGLGVAKPGIMIPADWIARIDREVILRKTLKDVMAAWGSTSTLSVAVSEHDTRMAIGFNSPHYEVPRC